MNVELRVTEPGTVRAGIGGWTFEPCRRNLEYCQNSAIIYLTNPKHGKLKAP